MIDYTATVDHHGWLFPHGQAAPRPVGRAATTPLQPAVFKVYRRDRNNKIVIGRIIADGLTDPPIAFRLDIETAVIDSPATLLILKFQAKPANLDGFRLR
jgi:hypothetical protein